jgi:ADP-ribose pyrophosphatase
VLPDDGSRECRFLGSTQRERLGKLTVREDGWRRADSWELPGGGLPGETPEAAAQRELREEGGYRAGRLTFLTRFFPSNAYLDETAHCFVGEELVADPLASDDDEFFERRVVPFREAVAMAGDDRITESASKVALLAAALRLGVRPW